MSIRKINHLLSKIEENEERINWYLSGRTNVSVNIRHGKPKTLIGFMAMTLGYGKEEIQGKSIYEFIQNETGWNLWQLTEITKCKNITDLVNEINQTIL